ncbi:MAG: rod-binding protein [Pseudodesulfovibrio sp.]
MLDSGIDVQLAARQADTSDLVRFKQEMDGLKERLAGPDAKDKTKKLRDACQKFEAVFIGKLWKEMRSTVKKEGYLHSRQEDQYLSMFDRDFAEKMAASGGIGLADLIYDQLSEKLKTTSRDTLEGGVKIKPLGAEPIALDKGAEPIALSGVRPMTLEQWGGRVDDVGETQAAAATAASTRPLTDVEVKARLETLARQLESERIKGELMDGGNAARQYGRNGKTATGDNIGREIAKNG